MELINERPGIGIVDYIVLAGVLLISTAIGVYYAITDKKKGAAADTALAYLMGDRQLPLIPVALSLLVSFQSAILVLGSSSEMYMRGSTYWWATVGISLSALLTCYLFVPVFYSLQLTSIYEYLELRFQSRLIRRIGAFLYILVNVIYLSIAMYAPSVALAGVSDILPLWALILLAGVVCTFYVAIGGMKAVIATDAVQALIMWFSLIIIAVLGTSKAGGIGNVWQVGREQGRIIYFDARLDPTVYMSSTSIVIGQLFSWLGWYGINQSAVQRYCGMPSARRGQIALLANIPALFLVVSLVCYIGLVMFAYFASCDPLQAGLVRDRDQLLPHFVLSVMAGWPGVSGLFVACLYSGTLSTVSSGLNSLAAVAYEDFFYAGVPVARRRATASGTKMLCLLFGVLCTMLSFLGPYLGGVLQAALSTMGAVNGPLTGMFLLGVLVPWANRQGVFAGVLVSGAVTTTLCVSYMLLSPHQADLPTSVAECQRFITNFTLNSTVAPAEAPKELTGLMSVFSLTYVYYDMIGVLTVFIVALPVSFATGMQDYSRLDKRLFHPWVLRAGGSSRKSSQIPCRPDTVDAKCSALPLLRQNSSSTSPDEIPPGFSKLV